MPQGDINKTFKSNQFRHEEPTPNELMTVEFRPNDPNDFNNNPLRMWARTDSGDLYYTVDGVNINKPLNQSDLGLQDIDWYGSGNGSVDDYTAFVAALNAIGTTPGTLLISKGNWRIGSNLTIPANVSLVFMIGGVLQPDVGVTITINGPVTAGIYQIFGGGGAFTGSLQANGIYPQWFGALGGIPTFDDHRGIQSAINLGRASGVTVVIPYVAGGYYTSQTLVGNSDSDQRAVKIVGAIGKAARFNISNVVTIKRQTGLTHTMMTAHGSGFQIENILFHGQSQVGDGLIITFGFEAIVRNVRIYQVYGTGLGAYGLANAFIENCNVDNCGYNDGITHKPAVKIAGSPVGGGLNTSNTVFVNFLNIERSRATALNVGYGSEIYDQAEFITFNMLHVEQVIDNTELPAYTTVPVVHLGNVRGIDFIAPFIYGGKGELLRAEATGLFSITNTSINVAGGTIMGSNAGGSTTPGTPNTLIHMVDVDYFNISGTQMFAALQQMILIDVTVGRVNWYNAKFDYTVGSGVDVVDNRTTLPPGRQGLDLYPVIADAATPAPNNVTYQESTNRRLTYKNFRGINLPLGQINVGTTAQRPAGLTANESGVLFFDFTLNALIMWTGSLWRKYDGTTV